MTPGNTSGGTESGPIRKTSESEHLQRLLQELGDGSGQGSGRQRLLEVVEQYLHYERVAEHRQYILGLVRAKEVGKLEQMLGKRLTFGTAGLRGPMGPGYSQMNDLVVIQTSQGLASYLLSLEGNELRSGGIIVGNDARHNSSRFARLVALAFLQKSVPVYLSEQLAPTPLIAFGVRHYGCRAGIVITASHNPKQDNGYKVYFSNGAQILGPHDRHIQEHILKEENLRPWPLAWRTDLLESLVTSQVQPGQAPPTDLTSSSSTITTLSLERPASEAAALTDWAEKLACIHGELTQSYFKYLEQTFVGPERRQKNQMCPIGITFTAMHGVGHSYLARALASAGFKRCYPVEAQREPNPDFPTVRFPNPEEAGALDMAFETAAQVGAELILANDPDADRCAAAIYEPPPSETDSGTAHSADRRRQLNGNELGALLGWWAWRCHKARHDEAAGPFEPLELKRQARTVSQGPLFQPSLSLASSTELSSSADPNRPASTEPTPFRMHSPKNARAADGFRACECYMISTAVSSKFLRSMAEREGFNFLETLTGFKYMGNLSDELAKGPKTAQVLFAFEEAIGYMCSADILDKDGISAALQVAQCAAHLHHTYGRTLEQQLDWLYLVYGYHYSSNSYFICRSQTTIRAIFAKLRANYPKSFLFKSRSAAGKDEKESELFEVKRVRDLYGTGFDSATKDNLPELPCSSSSYMVTFFVDKNITFTIRTSGTEPKIKYYSEIVAKLPALSEQAIETNNFNEPPQLMARQKAQRRLERFLQAAIEECLRPTENKLEPAAAIS